MKRKSRLIAGMLAIFLGLLGAHNFYLGHVKRALGQMVLSTIGGLLSGGIVSVIVWVWALAEGVMILTGRINTDGRGEPLAG